MAWNKKGNFAVLSLAFIFAACSGDSGSDAYEGVVTVSSGSKKYSNDISENCFDTYNIDGEKTGRACFNESLSFYDEPQSSSFESSSSTLSSSSAFVIDGNHFVDERDGLVYEKVTIGSQIWMAENLRLETENSSCWDWDFETNCSKSGSLYKWPDAIDSAGVYSLNGKGCGRGNICSLKYPIRGVCPVNWHIPTKDEFEELFTFIGGQSVAGKYLKSTKGWSQKGNGVDKYSFTAIPILYPDRGSKENEESIFWTSTKSDNNTNAFVVRFSYQMDSVDVYETRMYGEYSIRCVFDEKIEMSSSSKNSSSHKDYSSSSMSSNSSASIFEQDTQGWGDGEDGEIKAGNVTKSDYIYDAQLGTWREATTEEYSFGGCTEVREKEITRYSNVSNGLWFICKSREWVVADTIEVDTQGWENGSDGEIKKGDTTNTFYKYDEVLNRWMTANKNDTTLKLNSCTTKREGDVKRSSVDNKNYVCKGLDWLVAQEIDLDTYGELCASKDVGKIINGTQNEANKYYCSKKGWILITIDWSWDVPKEARFNPDISYGTITDKRDGKVYKTVKIGSQIWMAENLNYADTSKHALLREGNIGCWEGKEEYCEVAGRLYKWEAAILRTWGCSAVENACVEPMQGVCPSGWHVPDKAEWLMLLDAVGGKAKAAKILKSNTGWMNGGNGSDDVGFSAIPAGGTRYEYGYEYGKAALFWSAFSANQETAWRLRLTYDSETASLDNEDKSRKYSVRCIQN